MCYDTVSPINDRRPPTTFTEANRQAWTDWLVKKANWPGHLNIKSIRVVKSHAWTDALKIAHSKSHPHDGHNNCFVEHHLYHGTPEKNIESILTNGFFYSHTWLARSPQTSLSYMCGGNKLILSSVLTCTHIEPNQNGVIVMTESKRIVPIAVIELDQHY